MQDSGVSTFFCKQLFVDGQLASGMYTMGDGCATIELAKQTRLLAESDQATPAYRINGTNRRVAIVQVTQRRDMKGNILKLAHTIIEML